VFEAPAQPFLTEAIPLESGGLDYLGLRGVNLNLLAERLLPGINNATRDVGTYVLATWVAWKFRKMCGSEKEFTRSRFVQFREAVEVALSYNIRANSPGNEQFGEPHRKIGVQQKFEPPGELSFQNAKRGNSTSVFSAPLYGPSLRFLGLLTEAAATDQLKADIPIPSSDERTEVIVSDLDRHLANSVAYPRLTRLGEISLTESELDDLALAGLHPAFALQLGKRAKKAFISMLVPKDIESGRTITAKLLVATVKQYPGKTLSKIRAMWHTGLTDDGAAIKSFGTVEDAQRELWAVFQSRQYQRYIIECFLRCFEIALRAGIHSIDDMVAHFHRQSGLGKRTLAEFFTAEAADISMTADWVRVAVQWKKKVGPAHSKYLANCDELPSDSELCKFVFELLARWWIPMNDWTSHPDCQKWLTFGDEDRMSAKWFHGWVQERLDAPIQVVLHDIFEKLVFAQHVRIALSRFDGEGQRLRFALADKGITPMVTFTKLTRGIPGWTNDRLQSLADLLSDLSVLQVDEEQQYFLGDSSSELLD
jgi:hypothetical protein